ncbi:MAG: N-acetylmuramoyl-L-alanine amidase [Halothece sp.]
MKLHWLLIGSLVTTGLATSPAQAGGKLTSWQFNKNQNRLTFRTAEGVQPRAQLISDPTRVVIDLPRTSRGEAMKNQMIGGAVKEVRVGQFDEDTTRLVLELEEGYTLEPEEIRVQGENPQQWAVQLPSPQRQKQQEVAQPTSSPSRSDGEAVRELSHPNFRVTSSGLFLRLDSAPSGDIPAQRSDDGKRMSFRLPNTPLPSDLPEALPINNYGVSYAEFNSVGNGSEVVLHLNEDSPNWQAFPNTSGNGAVVMLPQGGMGEARQLSSPSMPQWVKDEMNQSQTAKVEAIDLVDNQLLVKADGRLTGTGEWDQTSGIYEMTIPNAELADPVRGPDLKRNSPISQIRVRQEDDDRVVVQIQAASGVQIEDQINQPSENLLAIGWQRGSSQARTGDSPNPQHQAIQVPPPKQRSLPRSTPSDDRKDQPLIVIDPGHGGRDPGAIGIEGLQEKNVVLPISRYVRDALEAKGVRVQMLRESDRFISLSGRAEMANRANADLFISIHANAISMTRPDVNGIETYYHSQGRALATSIHRSMLKNTNMRDRGVRQANFYVLRNSSMPAVLVETGFLTGLEDAPRLADDNFRQEMGEAIAEGILDYVKSN